MVERCLDINLSYYQMRVYTYTLYITWRMYMYTESMLFVEHGQYTSCGYQATTNVHCTLAWYPDFPSLHAYTVVRKEGAWVRGYIYILYMYTNQSKARQMSHSKKHVNFSEWAQPLISGVHGQLSVL